MVAGLKSLMIILTLCISQVAVASSLRDPTRPAISLNSGSASPARKSVRTEHAPRGLQSVIISPQRRAAIINGKLVSLGGKYGNATLIEVREDRVVLQNARGRRVLELFPAVHIKNNETTMLESNVRVNTPRQTETSEQAAGGIK